MASPASVSLLGSATVFVVKDVLRSVQHYCEVLAFHPNSLTASRRSTRAWNETACLSTFKPRARPSANLAMVP